MRRLFLILALLLTASSLALAQGVHNYQACGVSAQNAIIWCPVGVGPSNAVPFSVNIVPSSPVENAATGTTAGATATLPGVAGKTTYLCGFSFSTGSATTAITVTVTTTGLASNFSLSTGAPVTAVGVTGQSLVHLITPCLPASAANTAITVVIGALGAGGVGQSVNAWGFQF